MPCPKLEFVILGFKHCVKLQILVCVHIRSPTCSVLIISTPSPQRIPPASPVQSQPSHQTRLVGRHSSFSIAFCNRCISSFTVICFASVFFILLLKVYYLAPCSKADRKSVV